MLRVFLAIGDDPSNRAKQDTAERERIREMAIAELKRLSDRVGAQAKARGLTESILNQLLKN